MLKQLLNIASYQSKGGAVMLLCGEVVAEWASKMAGHLLSKSGAR